MADGKDLDGSAALSRRAMFRGATGLTAAAMTAMTLTPEAQASQVQAGRVAAAQDALLRRKQLRMFQVLDVDGDGAVTPADTVALAHLMGRLTEHSENSSHTQQLVATINQIWHALVIKPIWVSNLTRLNGEQFVTVMANSVATTPDKTLQYIGTLTNLIFGMIDTDNTGTIARGETTRLGVQALRLSQSDAEQGWDALDTGGRGQLSYAEMLKAITDFVTSTDPRAPGNMVLGPL